MSYLLSVYIINPISLSAVFLSLNGMTVPNDSYVLASSIIPGGSLICNTSRNDCCSASDNPKGTVQGHWYYPRGNVVNSYSVGYQSRYNNGTFFARSRDSGIVRLYSNGNPQERGRFRCEIPNASGDIETHYVNIGEYFHILMACEYGIIYSYSCS